MSAAERTRWSKPVNLSDALSGSPPPAPMVGRWTESEDGRTVQRALFYPNEVHSVFGDPEAMKSWALLLAAKQEITTRSHVFYLDMEANDRSIVERLQLLGASPTAIKKRFHYFRPDDRISDADHKRLRKLVEQHRPTLVVLDGVTEAFTVLGLSINSPEDTSRWFRMFARQLQVVPTPEYEGPAIVELDHMVKDRESRNGWAIGSIHKKAGIKGAAYQVVQVRPLGKGKHGVSRLFLEKDSPGGVDFIPYGRNRQRLAAELHCDATSEDGFVDAWFASPDPTSDRGGEGVVPLADSRDFRLLMHNVAKFVANNPSCSTRVLRAGVTGTNESIATAVEQLVHDGFVRNEGTPTRCKYVAVKEFSVIGSEAVRGGS